MVEENLRIKTMDQKEVEIAIEWAASEGWNPGLNDADNYYLADPTGFLIGYIEEKPVATISVVKYGKSFGFLGFYIVAPEYRGKGYGLQIWKAGIRSLEGRTIGLDGVIEQQKNYQKSGFKFAYRNIRFEGKGGSQVLQNTNIVRLSTIPFESIASYDRPFFPEEREQFMKGWIEQAKSHALGNMENDKLSGYGVIRKCRTGYKIGPLYANNSEIAEILYQALISKADTSEPVFLDVPEINKNAVLLAERNDMKIVFETARMYTGDFPELPVKRLYGVTSFEIG